MIPPLAHVAGLPVEESLLALLPAACALALIARATLSQLSRRMLGRLRPRPLVATSRPTRVDRDLERAAGPL